MKVKVVLSLVGIACGIVVAALGSQYVKDQRQQLAEIKAFGIDNAIAIQSDRERVSKRLAGIEDTMKSLGANLTALLKRMTQPQTAAAPLSKEDIEEVLMAAHKDDPDVKWRDSFPELPFAPEENPYNSGDADVDAGLFKKHRGAQGVAVGRVAGTFYEGLNYVREKLGRRLTDEEKSRIFDASRAVRKELYGMLSNVYAQRYATCAELARKGECTSVGNGKRGWKITAPPKGSGIVVVSLKNDALAFVAPFEQYPEFIPTRDIVSKERNGFNEALWEVAQEVIKE